MEDARGPGSHRWSALHEPFFRRLHRSGRDPRGFRGRRTRAYLVVGLLALASLVALAGWRRGLADEAVHAATLLSLGFLLATVGLWLGMGGRAFPVAGVIVVLVYALTTSGSVALNLPAVFLATVLVAFAMFALAGVYLVLVLEEMVYDAHRALRLRHRVWAFVPVLAAAALASGLWAWGRQGGPAFPATSATALASVILLGSWWFLRLFNEVRGEGLVLRELHLLVASAAVASLLADGLAIVQDDLRGALPGILGYGILLGTWVYVSYTTLQRTQFLLPARDPVAWLSLMLAASFAILAHTLTLFGVGGAGAVADLVALRVHYLIAGVWIGIVLLVVRGLLRAGRLLGDAVRGDAPARIAGGARKVTAGIRRTEAALGGAAVALYGSIERAIPGHHRGPVEPRWGRGWELDGDMLRRLDSEEEPVGGRAPRGEEE